MRYIHIILLLLLNYFLYSTSMFYNINWHFEKEKKGISLYIAIDPDTQVNYYKAQTVVKNISFDKIVKILSDFDNYNKFFPKTIIFKPIRVIGERRFIVYSLLNFFPYKNREYLVECCIQEEIVNDRKIFKLYWYPDTTNTEFNFNKKNHRIKNVYGMWQIEELENSEVKITFFSFNDWEITAPRNIKVEFEKDGTINNVLDLLNGVR